MQHSNAAAPATHRRDWRLRTALGAARRLCAASATAGILAISLVEIASAGSLIPINGEGKFSRCGNSAPYTVSDFTFALESATIGGKVQEVFVQPCGTTATKDCHPFDTPSQAADKSVSLNISATGPELKWSTVGGEIFQQTALDDLYHYGYKIELPSGATSYVHSVKGTYNYSSSSSTSLSCVLFPKYTITVSSSDEKEPIPPTAQALPTTTGRAAPTLAGPAQPTDPLAGADVSEPVTLLDHDGTDVTCIETRLEEPLRDVDGQQLSMTWRVVRSNRPVALESLVSSNPLFAIDSNEEVDLTDLLTEFTWNGAPLGGRLCLPKRSRNNWGYVVEQTWTGSDSESVASAETEAKLFIGLPSEVSMIDHPIPSDEVPAPVTQTTPEATQRPVDPPPPPVCPTGFVFAATVCAMSIRRRSTPR